MTDLNFKNLLRKVFHDYGKPITTFTVLLRTSDSALKYQNKCDVIKIFEPNIPELIDLFTNRRNFADENSNDLSLDQMETLNLITKTFQSQFQKYLLLLKNDIIQIFKNDETRNLLLEELSKLSESNKSLTRNYLSSK